MSHFRLDDGMTEDDWIHQRLKDDPIETAIEKLADNFWWNDHQSVDVDDVEEKMGELEILWDYDLDEPKVTKRELERMTESINERLKELFDE